MQATHHADHHHLWRNDFIRIALISLACAALGCTKTNPPLTNPLGPKTPLQISVAASTKDVMESIARAFDKEHTTTTKINPGPTSSLATQILEGAPVDLFLSANREFAQKINDAGLAADSKELLTNHLVLVVPKGNPAMVQKPEDLLESRVKKIALAGENVPAGKYADQALKKLKLFDELAAAGKFARGQDVRNALQFVETGEAEAGIVYSTDANGSSVQVVYEFDPSLHDKIVYVLLLLKHGDQNPNAKAFFDYAQSAAARDVFSAAGFQLLGAPQ